MDTVFPQRRLAVQSNIFSVIESSVAYPNSAFAILLHSTVRTDGVMILASDLQRLD